MESMGMGHASVIHCPEVKAKAGSRLFTIKKRVVRISQSICLPYKTREYLGLNLWSTDQFKDLFRVCISESLVLTRA